MPKPNGESPVVYGPQPVPPAPPVAGPELLPMPNVEPVKGYGPRPDLPVPPVAAADEISECPPLPVCGKASAEFSRLLRHLDQQHVHEMGVLNNHIDTLLLRLSVREAQFYEKSGGQDSGGKLEETCSFGEAASPRLSQVYEGLARDIHSSARSKSARNIHRQASTHVLQHAPEEINDDRNRYPRIGSGLPATSVHGVTEVHAIAEEPAKQRFGGELKQSTSSFLHMVRGFTHMKNNSPSQTCTQNLDEEDEMQKHKSQKKDALGERLREWQGNRRDSTFSHGQKVSSMTIEDYQIIASEKAGRLRKELIINMCAAPLILLNCVQIGLSSDLSRDWAGWLILDAIFSFAFLIEIILKVNLRGITQFFFHSTWMWSWFDAVVVVMAFVELIINVATSQGATSFNVSLFRVVRLLRLARIVNFLRLPFFKELQMMLQGMKGGVRTLFWSMVLLMFPLYLFAILFRDTLGEGADRFEEFRTMGWCMFTVFRCLMGDCTNESGQPIFVHVLKSRGWGMALLYCAMVAITFFGLFNVIVAIFVENTLAAAKSNDVLQRRRRLQDNERKTRLASKLVHVFMEEEFRQKQGAEPDVRISYYESSYSGLDVLLSDDHRQLMISRAFFSDLMRRKDVQKLLDDLDVAEEDRIDLFDILDADCSGSLELHELVHGIIALRGAPRRSDTVSCQLLLASLRDKIDELDCIVKDQHRICLKAIHGHSRPTSPTVSPSRHGLSQVAFSPNKNSGQ